MSRIRVLLVDDHTVVRQGLRLVLEREPSIEVVGEAGDGEQALAMAAALKPEIVVMDVSMPVMDGLEATRQLKRLLPDCQVVALTVHQDDDYVLGLLRAGASAYLPKKAAAAELVAAVQAASRGENYLHPAVTRTVLDDYLRAPPLSPDPLTPRERQILKLVAEGKTNREVAEMLSLSVKTVETHRTNLMQKLGKHDLPSLVRYAIKVGLVEL